MLAIAATLAQNLFSRVETRIDETMARTRRSAGFIAFAGVMLITAYVLAVVAGCVALSDRYGTVPALAGLAAALFGAALIALAVLAYLNRRDRRRRERQRRRTQSKRDVIALAATMATRKPLVATGLALAVGFLLAPRSRRERSDD